MVDHENPVDIMMIHINNHIFQWFYESDCELKLKEIKIDQYSE